MFKTTSRKKTITGDILTTDYLYFNQPKALQELQQYPNLNIRIYTKENFPYQRLYL